MAWCWLRFGSPVIPCELLPWHGAGSGLVPRFTLASIPHSSPIIKHTSQQKCSYPRKVLGFYTLLV